MLFHNLRLIILLLTASLLLVGAPVKAAVDEQKLIVQAEKNYRRDRPRSFASAVRPIKQDSVYYPLVRYWQSIMKLRRNHPEAIEQYLPTAQSPYLAQQARRKLLEYYAGKKQWQQFRAAVAGAGDCPQQIAALQMGKADRKKLRTLWREDTKMNSTLCLSLYQQAYKKQILNKDDVWIKIRSLAGDKKLSATKRLLRYFPKIISYSKVRKVVNRARRYVQGKHSLAGRANRELVMIAAMAAVRGNPKTAISRWHKFSQYFSAEENDHVWTVLATWAARWHREDALALYRATTGKYADEHARAWFVRAALRNNDYAKVLRGVDAMPPAEAQLSAWRYWRAIALQQQQQHAAATAELVALATEEEDFYGLLAREEVGHELVQSQPPPAAATAVNAPFAGDFALALAVRQAGLASLARGLWRHAARVEEVSETQLIVAAHKAAQAKWPLASIDAANRIDTAATAHHLRFPFPYKQEILSHSKKRGLDPAFVYGLIRQESRFMPRIVSSAKAQGLMQVIPRTARAVARAHGYHKYHVSRLKRVDTNMTIGTTYLANLADNLNAAPAMVAAAYNAGPSRVKKWYRSSEELLIAIENIPITETRLYVKYVLANRLHYRHRLGLEVPPMTHSISQSIHSAAL